MDTHTHMQQECNVCPHRLRHWGSNSYWRRHLISKKVKGGAQAHWCGKRGEYQVNHDVHDLCSAVLSIFLYVVLDACAACHVRYECVVRGTGVISLVCVS